jgi:hypothetical protein
MGRESLYVADDRGNRVTAVKRLGEDAATDVARGPDQRKTHGLGGYFGHFSPDWIHAGPGISRSP